MSPSSGPDPELAARKYHRGAASYDRIMERTSRRMRRLAVDTLQLRAGQVVLDVACGTGLSFALIEQRIGPTGRLIGIDLSADMLQRARDRANDNGWDNVILIESPIEEAQIDAQGDAALFVLSHDVIRSTATLEYVTSHLKPEARVAVAGAKWAERWWATPVNLIVWLIARRYVTTFEGMHEPWNRLPPYMQDLRVRSLVLGGAYVASGTVRSIEASPPTGPGAA